MIVTSLVAVLMLTLVLRGRRRSTRQAALDRLASHPTTQPARWRRRVMPRRRHRSPPPAAAHLAELLDRVARRCSGGDSLTSAVEASLATSSVSQHFAPALRSLRAGTTLAEAIDTVPASTADAAYALHVLRVSALHGGRVSEGLDRAAAALRARHTLHQERIAHSAQARLSARVLTVLPIAFAGWTSATSPDVRRFLITAPGIACCSAGVALNVAGSAWMRRLIGGPR